MWIELKPKDERYAVLTYYEEEGESVGDVDIPPQLLVELTHPLRCSVCGRRLHDDITCWAVRTTPDLSQVLDARCCFHRPQFP